MFSSSNKTQLGMERLEDRSLPAAINYFVLDFTPDTHAGSFADTFRYVKTAAGYAPNFLDFNRDGWVNNTDIQLAATQVANRVASFYAPFMNNAANHLNIQYGDILSNTNMGTNWLAYGRANPSVQVSVMYIGGTSNQGLGTLGRAPLAGAGENMEGYGESYSRSAAISLLGNSAATPAMFVAKLANATAHELGHMMGLSHTYGDPNNIMNAYQSYSPGSAYFVNGWQSIGGGYTQQAYRELDASFQLNQRQVTGQTAIGGQYQLDHLEDGCDHDHEELAGLTEGVRLAPEAAAPKERGQHHVIESKSFRNERFEQSKPQAKESQTLASLNASTVQPNDDAFEFNFSVALK